MNHPLLYEINTRCWLRELSQRYVTEITLANVPEAQFAAWQRHGFTHIWLMGVWTTGPRARAEAFKHDDLIHAYNFLLPGWKPEDIAGSCYSIAAYEVPSALGGDAGLAKFRERLHAHGMKLVLDFVPNHLGLDHPWCAEKPELFVHGKVGIPGWTFRVETGGGPVFLAHGKDPHFAPWIDTVQLDYRRAATRAAMLDLLQSIAARCDGVRCDMAMLLLNEVFAQTWKQFPAQGTNPVPKKEFWEDAIPAVRQAHPGFIFLAEVYWSLEGHLQSLGFDFTYDKHLFDLLVSRRTPDVQVYLLASPPRYVAASAHFLENHDEERIAPRLSLDEHRAAALLILGLPGMRFLHEGQLIGAPHHYPVQMGRRPLEKTDKVVAALYEKLLSTLQETAVGSGTATILKPRRAWDGNPTAGNFVIVQWQSKPMQFDLIVVNLATHRSQCYVPLEVEDVSTRDWFMRDLLGSERYERFGDDLAQQGLYLDVPPHAAQLFRFDPR
jgi:hypothetical protein